MFTESNSPFYTLNELTTFQRLYQHFIIYNYAED